MQRRLFVLLVLIGAMLGALVSMVDSDSGWDDTGVGAAVVLGASGLVGALHPQRAWTLAVGSWIPALGITLSQGYASMVALGFALVGAYAGLSPAGG